MKIKLTLALAAAITGTAFGTMPAHMPEFKNEKQLAEWRAEKAAEPASQGYATEQSAFYTGKPYVESSGGYAFKFRSYNPGLARWTSEDPSGFPDGANCLLYVNNMATRCIDVFGMDIYAITNPTAAGGFGHVGMISGSGTNYLLQSYGPGSVSAQLTATSHAEASGAYIVAYAIYTI